MHLPPPETVCLQDGTEVVLRPIRPDDAPRLQALHARLSPASIYLRFLGMHLALSDQEARRLATLDYDARMAFVAAQAVDGEDGERLLGVARYASVSDERRDEAEVAVVVEDACQGQGVGTLLIERLIAYARAHGIRHFVAEVSAENDRILWFVRRSRLPAEKRLENGVWQIRVRLG